MVNTPIVGTILLALGGNMAGRWGSPRESLARALSELQAAGIKVVSASPLYRTGAVGSGRQPHYLNAVVVAKGAIAPGRLLHLLKSLERRAGRRSTPPMQPRPLDIDILDYGGRRLNRPPSRRERGRLILPHPLLDRRAFVLVPLMKVAPRWTHPVIGCRAKTLLARLGPSAALGIRRCAETPLLHDCG